MELRCERRGQNEVGTIDEENGFFASFEDEAELDPRRIERQGCEMAHGCGGCGEVKPGVDLWAEDRETGEELWLCETCADW